MDRTQRRFPRITPQNESTRPAKAWHVSWVLCPEYRLMRCAAMEGLMLPPALLVIAALLLGAYTAGEVGCRGRGAKKDQDLTRRR